MWWIDLLDLRQHYIINSIQSIIADWYIISIIVYKRALRMKKLHYSFFLISTDKCSLIKKYIYIAAQLISTSVNKNTAIYLSSGFRHKKVLIDWLTYCKLTFTAYLKGMTDNKSCEKRSGGLCLGRTNNTNTLLGSMKAIKDILSGQIFSNKNQGWTKIVHHKYPSAWCVHLTGIKQH